MNKDYLAPWQIIRKLRPKTDPALARLPPLLLNWLGVHVKFVGRK